MDRMKTFLIYVLIVVGFFIFSDFIINVGLNSTYKNMESKNSLEQVNIKQAEATSVNGRILGSINNSGTEDINGKFLKIDIFSERDVFLGSKYYDIQNIEKDQSKDFELYFKTNHAKYYGISIVNEKKQDDVDIDIEFISKDLSKPEIWFAAIVTMLILW